MPDLSLLVPLLLAIRIGLDLVAIANHGTSYQLEFGYCIVFAAAAVVLLITDVGDGWGWLAGAIAAYSLGAFFVKRAKRDRPNAESAT
jgi:hypothetical protein